TPSRAIPATRRPAAAPSADDMKTAPVKAGAEFFLPRQERSGHLTEMRARRAGPEAQET
ncbi:MAG: hypothetical protein FD124_1558, partial [Alphaproteobacteria bacterium]